MNLIEKVGGIEKAKTLNSMLEKHAVPEDWKISIVYGMWQRSSVGFTHSDLRTAIAQHDCKHNWQDVTAIGNTERVFICSYCSKQKSAPFCIDKFDVEGAEEFLRDREQGSNASEFKAGDLVVFDITKPYCANLPDHIMEYNRVSPNCEHDVLVWIDEKLYEVSRKAIRHITPNEAYVGHRVDHPVQDHEVIELSGNTGGLETAEMIDYSPMCEVIDK